MTSIASTSTPGPMPSGKFATSAFYYENLQIQQTLTALRSAIEGRRGLIVLSGETGIGKSRLLQKLAGELEPNVVSIVPADPRLKFSDILRLILGGLEVKNHDEDEAAMLRSCKFHLRGRMQRRQIVTLMFDNAQHLEDSTLKQLAENFLAGGPSIRDDHLLQIVLAGRPQFKDKLPLAARVADQPITPLICELRALEGLESAAFLAQGLRANGLAPALFAPSAAVRIAEISGGNPSVINALCERALQLSVSRASGSVTRELIDAVAADLKLKTAAPPAPDALSESAAETADVFALGEMPIAENESGEFQIGEKDSTEVLDETFLQYRIITDAYDSSGWARPQLHNTRWTKVLSLAVVLLVLIIVTSAWLRSDSNRNPLMIWKDMFAADFNARQPNGRMNDTVPAKPNTDAAPSVPASDAPSPLAVTPEDQSDRVPTTEQVDKLPVDPRAAPTDHLPSSKSVTTSPPAAEPVPAQSPAISHDPPRRSEGLEGEVAQAIENRAIIGVAVSVVDGTVILHGRVASERQRSTAERAAWSVNGVKQVRNQITVS